MDLWDNMRSQPPQLGAHLLMNKLVTNWFMCISSSTLIPFILKSTTPHAPPRKQTKNSQNSPPPVNELLSISFTRYFLKPGYRS